MKKLNAFMDVAHLIGAVLVIVVLGALMYTITDLSVMNASKNGSGAISALLLMLPLLIVITVVVSFLKFGENQ